VAAVVVQQPRDQLVLAVAELVEQVEQVQATASMARLISGQAAVVLVFNLELRQATAVLVAEAVDAFTTQAEEQAAALH
jgi:hypothetical protein